MSSFSFFYPGNNVNPLYIINNRVSSSILDLFFILNSLFSFLNSNSQHGGAVFISTSDSIKFLVEKSFFNFCNVGNSLNGGGIYFSCNKGESVLSKICAYECFTGTRTGSWVGYGQFSYILTKNIGINSLYYSTISKSSPNHDIIRNHPILFYNGNTNLSSTNISNNKLAHSSGLFLYYIQNTFIDFCSISNNNSSENICIYIESKSSIISKCNIINNNQFESTRGIITQGAFETLSNSTFQSCVFLYNAKIFNAKMFCIHSGQLFLNQCYSDSLSYNSLIFFQYNAISSTNTIFLFHFQTALCLVQNPLFFDFTQKKKKTFNSIIFFTIELLKI